MAQVNITVSADKLAELINSGALSGSEISSEDFIVKQLIQSLCLKGCARKLCSNCAFADCCGVSLFGQQKTYISADAIL